MNIKQVNDPALAGNVFHAQDECGFTRIVGVPKGTGVSGFSASRTAQEADSVDTVDTAKFDSAVSTLLGESNYSGLTLGDPPLSRSELCELIAKEMFIDRLASNDQDALAVVQSAARHFWIRKGNS